ncbi:MAG: hypothetical protein KKD59_07785 [Acidobacteria bacterium]|nr:hypothetical protein [Acidobacteriota bacterium]
MKNKKQKTISFITLSAVVILLAIAVSAADVNLSFDHFYDNAELTQALKDLQKAYPQFVKMESLGKSHGGLDIWSVVINNPQNGAWAYPYPKMKHLGVSQKQKTDSTKTLKTP